jgi:hypothetical protein
MRDEAASSPQWPQAEVERVGEGGGTAGTARKKRR